MDGLFGSAVCKETPCSGARGLIVGSYANSSLRQASGDLGGEVGHGNLDLLVGGHVADGGGARGDLVGPEHDAKRRVEFVGLLELGLQAAALVVCLGADTGAA